MNGWWYAVRYGLLSLTDVGCHHGRTMPRQTSSDNAATSINHDEDWPGKEVCLPDCRLICFMHEQTRVVYRASYCQISTARKEMTVLLQGDKLSTATTRSATADSHSWVTINDSWVTITQSWVPITQSWVTITQSWVAITQSG